MPLLPCPYIGADVELTEEREQHIAARHPDLIPGHRELISGPLADPDRVRHSTRFSGARLFSRWYNGLAGGKYVVVVVVSDAVHDRHWIVTAYIARSLAHGVVEWQRS